MSPSSIQEVIHRHTSHFTPVKGWNHPDLPKMRAALHEAAFVLERMLFDLDLTYEQYRESLRDIHNAIAERRHELF